MRRIATLLTAALAVMGPLSADQITLGTPVAGPGETEQVGYVNNGWIHMYIPLEGSGTYGVNGFGTEASWHYNNYAGDVSGGELDMWLYFGSLHQPVSHATLELKFKDLDLGGVNDPYYTNLWLFEGVEFYDDLGNKMGEVFDIDDDSQSVSVTGNHRRQKIVLDLLGLGYEVDQQLHMRLLFNSDVYYGKKGWIGNTLEKIKPILSTEHAVVPEPTTYLMLGGLLLTCAVISRRRRAATIS